MLPALSVGPSRRHAAAWYRWASRFSSHDDTHRHRANEPANFLACLLMFRPVRRWLDRHMPPPGRDGTLFFEMVPVTFFAVFVVSFIMTVGELIVALV